MGAIKPALSRMCVKRRLPPSQRASPSATTAQSRTAQTVALQPRNVFTTIQAQINDTANPTAISMVLPELIWPWDL